MTIGDYGEGLPLKQRMKEFIFGDEYGMRPGIGVRIGEEIGGRLYDLAERLVRFPRATDVWMRTERRLGERWLTGRNFGMYQPAYAEALGEEGVARLRTKEKPVVLEVGIMGRETAKDLLRFGKQLNANARILVLDLDARRLRVSKTRGVTFLNADTTSVPLADDSCDLIMEEGVVDNFLIMARGRIEDVGRGDPELGGRCVSMVKELAGKLVDGGQLMMIEPSHIFSNEVDIDGVRVALGEGFVVETIESLKYLSSPKEAARFVLGGNEKFDFGISGDAMLKIKRVSKEGK